LRAAAERKRENQQRDELSARWSARAQADKEMSLSLKKRRRARSSPSIGLGTAAIERSGAGVDLALLRGQSSKGTVGGATGHTHARAWISSGVQRPGRQLRASGARPALPLGERGRLPFFFLICDRIFPGNDKNQLSPPIGSGKQWLGLSGSIDEMGIRGTPGDGKSLLLHEFRGRTI
jgi:hypothetical protein